jgi:hypothetical protein
MTYGKPVYSVTCPGKEWVTTAVKVIDGAVTFEWRRLVSSLKKAS